MLDQAKTHLQITGLSCAGCVRRAETALAGVPGVISAEVSFASESAQVQHDPAVRVEDLTKALETAGYPLTRTRVELQP